MQALCYLRHTISCITAKFAEDHAALTAHARSWIKGGEDNAQTRPLRLIAGMPPSQTPVRCQGFV